jgi:hypothetical protein
MNITIVVAGTLETGKIMTCIPVEKPFEGEPEKAAGKALKSYGVG